MRKLLILAALMLAPSAALAQTTPAPTSDTSVQGSAQAANNVTVVADAGRYAPADTSVKYSGHTYTTPAVAGSYFGGANPCLVGTGGGAAGGPVGFSLNIGKSDKGCTRRSDAAAWHALGYDNVAVARMCQDLESADAFFSATGMACPGTSHSGRYKLADGSKAPEMVIPAAAVLAQQQAQQAPQQRR
jgi:hypothetical protein